MSWTSAPAVAKASNRWPSSVNAAASLLGQSCEGLDCEGGCIAAKEILAWPSIRTEGHAKRLGPRDSLRSECDPHSHPVEEEVA